MDDQYRTYELTAPTAPSERFRVLRESTAAPLNLNTAVILYAHAHQVDIAAVVVQRIYD